MRILLSYSSELFDPRVPAGEQKHRGSSANIISRTLYESLSRRGDVTFIDAASPEELEGQRFDLFVGILRNFSRILELCEAERSILVGVNMHPAEHNRLLLDFVVREGLPTTAMHPLDLHDVEGRMRDIDSADLILLFGNVRTLNSYVANGVPAEKIKLVNAGSDLEAQDPPAASTERTETHLVYCASEIGLRKGFDLMEGAVTAAGLDRLGAHLHIVGKASYDHYRRQVEQLTERLGAQVTDHGWLPANSASYRELLERADYLFFPSLEEGQAGTVLDAMACGVIPLISENCGIDFAPLGFCELETASGRNVDLMREACELPADQRDRLREKTLEYYDEFHGGFERRLDVAVGDLIDDRPRPHVSVVLPVYNKEGVLPELLRLLDRALLSYGAADLCMILDGCTDDSERVARRFFRDRNGYPVEILTTPDIFEVRNNNLGLQRAIGRYAVIVQDDNFIYDPDCILEAVTFMERSGRAAIVGGLAGVNYYPKGTQGLAGPGQVYSDDNEVYWRQDAATDPALTDRIFEVDACMRGPLFLSKEFLEEHGYLDEAFVPLHCDDMDLCFRAASVGRKVYAILMDVENDSLTMKAYDSEKSRWFSEIARRNLALFYERWTPSIEKDYLWMHRTRIEHRKATGETVLAAPQRARRRYLAARRRWLNRHRAIEVAAGVKRRLRGAV